MSFDINKFRYGGLDFNIDDNGLHGVCICGVCGNPTEDDYGYIVDFKSEKEEGSKRTALCAKCSDNIVPFFSSALRLAKNMENFIECGREQELEWSKNTPHSN